jgi:3-hydroxymyristoyl/3-hydroxydecanoyl-(acyl carrier protein) dehydratase
MFAGEAEFGYFTDSILSEQAGLDAGRDMSPWCLSEVGAASMPVQRRALPRSSTVVGLQLLDEVLVVPGGGSTEQGYVYARSHVDPASWYFAAHFHEDPVMPGSLGIEAILQAMWYYALELDLASDFASPRYTPLPNHRIVWKYRGQILPSDQLMQLEVHISRIERHSARLVLVGDAWLWNGDRRIYAVRDAGIAITDSAAV